MYRDITTRKFTNGKTAEVIRQAVSGWEILQEGPTPAELAAVWNDWSIWMGTNTKKGLAFSFDYRERFDESKNLTVLEGSTLKCTMDGELKWSTDLDGFFAEGYLHTRDGVLVWGFNETWSSVENSYPWLAFVDAGGKLLWQKHLYHGYQRESVNCAVSDADGTFALMGKAGSNFCFTRIDADGRELAFRSTSVGNLGVWNAAKLSDGYIVQLGNTTTGDTALLFKVDHEGNMQGNYSYEAEDCVYHITGMAEFAGEVYLSAYAVPVQKDAGGRDEIANILRYIFDGNRWDIPGEALTPKVRDNYTAVLLVCDPDGGSPRTFWSVKGSLGGALSAEDGILQWDVESITSTFFSPATSSFTIGGLCSVYRYTFDESGSLIGQTDTGESVPYRR